MNLILNIVAVSATLIALVFIYSYSSLVYNKWRLHVQGKVSPVLLDRTVQKP